MQSLDLLSLKTHSLGNFIQSYGFKYHLYIDSHIYISAYYLHLSPSHIYISPLNSRISSCLPNISTRDNHQTNKFICPQLKSFGKPLLPLRFLHITYLQRPRNRLCCLIFSHCMSNLAANPVSFTFKEVQNLNICPRFQVLVHWSRAPTRPHLSYCSRFLINLFLPLLTLFPQHQTLSHFKVLQGLPSQVEAKVHPRPSSLQHHLLPSHFLILSFLQSA